MDFLTLGSEFYHAFFQDFFHLHGINLAHQHNRAAECTSAAFSTAATHFTVTSSLDSSRHLSSALLKVGA
jgi:hypothetical protein